ncbi:amino acid permease [Mesoplasma corruscae]|uniref:Amino acid permease family protein n=1 Tax=Mesoplasma corruscae TaxID=216874 RepID=A0A2S5RGT2_9MOLU|nr:amino acid permease [Mesoplasma corruscae]PPE06508.1 amino acid permease family protein [Mesoplasma corruscae]
MRNKSFTKSALVFLVFAIVFSFRNIINNQSQFGIMGLFLFLIGGIIYAIPITFVSIEFNSIKKLKDNEAGLGGWCIYSLGKKNGFIASWTSYFANVFFFATLAPFAVISISFVLMGDNGFDMLAKHLVMQGYSENNATRYSTMLLSLFAIILFWFTTYLSKKGPNWIKYITNIGGTASLFLGLIFIVIGLFVTVPFIHKSVSPTWSWEFFDPLNSNFFNGNTWAFMSAVPWVFFAYNGIETIAVFQKDLKGDYKAFKIGAILGNVFTIIIMVICGLTMSLAIDQNLITEWGISNSYYKVFPALFGLSEQGGGVWYQLILRSIAFIFAINSFGALAFWTVGPAKVFYSEVPYEAAGKILSKTDHNGIPRNALNFQFIIVVLLLVLVGTTTKGAVGQGTSEFLQTITQATTSLAIIPFIYLFVGYIKIRLNEEIDKQICFIKNKYVATLFAIFILFILIMALFFGIIPSPESWKDDWSSAIVALSLSFFGTVVSMGFAYFMWYWNVDRIKNNQLKNTWGKSKK